MSKKFKTVGKVKQKFNSDDLNTEVDQISQDIDSILKSRWHGAVNIRGIRYQILYSLLRAFDLYNGENSKTALRLEGIEDLDLIGFHYPSEYVQVKSSDKSWNWSKIKEPLANFLEVQRSDHNCKFILAVNFPLTGDLEKLAQLESLANNEKERIRNQFFRLCCDEKIGASRTTESEHLLSQLEIISISEAKIWQELKIVVAKNFNLGSDAVETYISTFIAKFLEWAKDRKTVTRIDMENIRGCVGEALSRETEFQAYGQGFINKVTWKQDETPTDFFDGKGTRSGHIVLKLDIDRLTWREKIDLALNVSNVCILRSSSGQGKSTLLYRYAYETRSPENIFTLRIAETPEQVEVICNYLQFRAGLNLPILLLIDDVRWQTRLWASVAQQGTALGIKVLVTIRDEDWQRFAQESLINYEVLDLRLELEEAKQIFQQFKEKGKLHNPQISPEEAYEKIGNPYLLMEFTYLLTQGRMLEERLRDQVKQIYQQQEDSAKVEILRRTTLAHALGTPLLVEKLLQGITFRSDPQQILQSLLGEYLHLENGMLTGLHWVRSSLLSKILHENYINSANTALVIFEAVPLNNISVFIANAMTREDINTEIFLNGLIERVKRESIENLLIFLDGIFEAGEYNFFNTNKQLFDEANNSLGSKAYFLLSINQQAISQQDLNPLDSLKDLAKDNEGLQEFFEINSKIIEVPRGLNLCANFLQAISPFFSPQFLSANLKNTGILLDWCFLCGVNLPNWQESKNNLLNQLNELKLSLEEFCGFTQGFYRYDQSAYDKWFLQNENIIISYLRLELDCIGLTIVDSEVSIQFIPDAENFVSVNDEAMFRLHSLRDALPFCKFYKSQGICLLPFELKPSIDETYKKISKNYLPFRSDISKNRVFMSLVERSYGSLDSYYKYEKSWYEIRKKSLLLCNQFSLFFKISFSGKLPSQQILDELSKLIVQLQEELRFTHSISSTYSQKNTSPSIQKMFSDNLPEKWSASFMNFINLFIKWLNIRQDAHLEHLIVHNFKEANKILPQMHQAFDILFEEAPNYFDLAQLNSEEIKTYEVLSDFLEVWMIDKLQYIQGDIFKFIKNKKEQKRIELLQTLTQATAPLREVGINFILPNNLYIDHPLRYLPISYSVNNPCHPEIELILIIPAISKIKDIAEFFCFIPLYQGHRFLENNYQISSMQISEILEGNIEQWEALVPIKFPEGIWNCLPEMPLYRNLQQQFYTSMYGLIAGFDMLLKRQKLVNSFPQENSFDIDYYNKYLKKLATLIESLKVTVLEIKETLHCNFSSHKDSLSYLIIDNYLQILITMLDQGYLNHISNFDIQLSLDSLISESLALIG